LLTGAKDLFPEVKCTVIFQPHLYSRTKDQAEGFAETLGMADEVILLPIYPARELPMEGVNSEMLVEKMKGKKVTVLSKEALMQWMKTKKASLQNDMIIMAGAGDIDAVIQEVKDLLA